MTTRLVIVAVIGLVWVAAPMLRADRQTAVPPASAATIGTAQIGGVVASADGANQPIRRAIVSITAPELRGTRQIATDDRGRFLFVGLPVGRYQLAVSKPGYLNAEYGQKRWRGSGTPISLADSQKELGLTVPLSKGAVVTGLVTDEFGLPIEGARVDVSEKATVEGQLALVPAAGGTTDDRGVYRVYGLPPGTFFVIVIGLSQQRVAFEPTSAADVRWASQPSAPGAASGNASPPPARQAVAFTPVFYPSAIDASAATPIDLVAGAERSGVDLVARFVPVARIAGTVTMADGRPASSATLTLVPDQTTSGPVSRSANLTPRATMSPDGGYVFDAVRVGQYSVIAQASSQAGAGRGRGSGPLDVWGEVAVRVDGRDVTGANIVLQPGMTISGRIVCEPTAAGAPNPQAVRVGLPVAPRAGAAFGAAPLLFVPQAAVSVDGTFTITGVAPGWYRLAASTSISGPGAPPTWVPKSVVVAGREMIDRPFEIRPGENIEGAVITMTDKIASLSGKLVDGQGKPAPEYVVIVLPLDRTLWVPGAMRSPRIGRPASNGSYRFDALPPGEYYVAAATDVDNADLYTASFLEQFIPAAVKLTIAEGEKKVQDMKVGTGLISTVSGK